MATKRKTPEISEKNFRKAPAVKRGKAVIHLPLYQRRWIEDRSRIKIGTMCRQAGKDFSTALEAVLDGLETKQDWFIVSLGLRQAIATGEKAKLHCRAITGMTAEVSTIDWEYQRAEGGELFKIQAAQIVLPGGAKITCLPGKDPDVLAGLSGNVIFTEFALFPNNGKDHWRVIFPLITRGYKLRIITTPRGPDTKAAELRRNIQGKYSVHNVDIHTAIREGLELTDEEGEPITAEELRALYNDEVGWAREYLIQESDELEALISWASIQKCEVKIEPFLWKEITGPDMSRVLETYNPSRENMFASLAGLSNRKSLGWDIAVKGHLSVITIDEVIGDVKWDRACIIMHRVNDFDYQEAVVAQAMRTLEATGVGDETGLGAASCQALEKQFPNRFKGVNFSTAKIDLATGLKKEVDGGRKRIPAQHPAVGIDFHCVQTETIGAAKRPHLVETENPDMRASHCDLFYSNAMATDAAATNGNSTFIQAW